ncbi:MAG: phenylacetate--CoA ligase family protein, partial [Candidatus Binatia bacterium]
TANGVNVVVRASGGIDRDQLAAELGAAFHRLGLPEARPAIAFTDRIARHPQSGKIKRFVPLAS